MGKRIIIIGAGVAGLTAGYYLKKRGFDVSIVEAEKAAGGALRSGLKEEKYVVELGGQFFWNDDDALLSLARELSIDRQIVGEKHEVFDLRIFSHGKLRKLPRSLHGGIVRFLFSKLMHKKDIEEGSAAAYCAKRFGRGALDSIVDPFISYMNAGDPWQLEAKSVLPWLIGSGDEENGGTKKFSSALRNAMRRQILSFHWGMGTLTARLEETLRSGLRTETAAAGIRLVPDGRFLIRLEGSSEILAADAVVIATPSTEAARLVSSLDHELSNALDSIPYAPVAQLHFSYLKDDVKMDPKAAGFLVPRKEGVKMLGGTFSSELFPSRCPAKEIMISCLVGGATNPGIIDQSDDDIMKEAAENLRTMFKINSAPRFAFLKRWNRAMPQYTIGHYDRIFKLEGLVQRINGLAVTGNYFKGISASDTIAHARQTADRLAFQMK